MVKPKPKQPTKAKKNVRKPAPAPQAPPRSAAYGQPPVAQGAGVLKRSIQLPMQPVAGSTLASLMLG